MSKAAVALSVLALAGSGFTAWKTGVLCTSCGACERPEPGDVAALEARIRALEEHATSPARGPAPLSVLPPSSKEAADVTGLATAPRPLTVAPSTPTSATPDVMADLQKRLATLEEAEKTRAKSGDVVEGPQLATAFAGNAPKFYGSVDDAAKDLDLSPRQKDDFERAVADAKRDMEELKKIPDSDGETWADAEKGMFKAGADGAMKFDLGKVLGFPSRKIPGRTETFGEAQAKISDNAKRRLRETLTPDQQKKFDKAHVQPLIGGGGGAMISFSTTVDTNDDAGMK